MLSNSCENVPTWCCLNVILESCKNIATTLRESCENVGTWSFCNKFQESFYKCCYNVATKRCKKTSPQHYGNIHRQRRSVMIFTMLWQPFSNMGKSATKISGHAIEKNWRCKKKSYASVATTLSESYGNVAYLRCCNVIQEHCSNVEQQLWKCSHLMLPQRHTRKLQKHCHNVEGKLWKRWHMKFLQQIPGKFLQVLLQRCHKTL